MDQKLDKIIDEVAEIKIIVAKNTFMLEKNTEDIEHHIKRTDLLQDQMQTALIPIRFAKWSAAVLGVGATIIGAIYGMVEIYQAIARG